MDVIDSLKAKARGADLDLKAAQTVALAAHKELEKAEKEKRNRELK